MDTDAVTGVTDAGVTYMTSLKLILLPQKDGATLSPWTFRPFTGESLAIDPARVVDP